MYMSHTKPGIYLVHCQGLINCPCPLATSSHWCTLLYLYLIPWSYALCTLPIFYQEGRTALLVACWREHYDIVHQLLVAGASPNAQDQVRGCGHNISADSLRISIVIRYNRRAWLHWSLQHKRPVQISSLPWWMQMQMQISQKRFVV